MMLDREKKVHRPERLKGYDYSSPGCYFVTFNTKARGEDILCKVVEGSKEAEAFLVGPDPLVRPFPLQEPGLRREVSCVLTQAGEIVRALIERIPLTYSNAGVDCYVIMPDHVHLLLWIWDAPQKRMELPEGNGLTRGSGPTKKASLPQVIRALKSLSSKRVGYPLWQERYYDHIIRNQQDLENARQYIQNNPLKWVLGKE